MIKLYTLGALDLRDADGVEIRSVLAQPKRLALFAYLAVAAHDRFVRRDSVLAMFWPESDDERARGAFRQSVRYLRRSLGDGVLVNRAEEELGLGSGTVWCDAVEIRAALARGDAAEALALYRGDLLDGLFVADAPPFEHWLDAERTALRTEIAAAAWTLADAALDAGNPAQARESARRAIDLTPLDERAVRRWIRLLDLTGDRPGAVHAYEEFARRLADELDLEPASETRGLIQDIRRSHPVPADNPTPNPTPTPTPTANPVPTPTIDAATDPLAHGIGHPHPHPHPHPRPAPARLAVSGAVTVLALTALAYLALPRTNDPPLEPRRVLVMPFENRTGDSNADPVANMAADWIVQGLAGRGALQVVPVTAALTSLPHLGGTALGSDSGPDPRAMAYETGAGTAVSGSYYRQGDSLYFQARITDEATGRVIAAIGPIWSAMDAPLEAIDRMRRQVLVALAPLSDERDTHVRVATAPPSYEAYQAYVSGFESFVRQDVVEALRHFERSAAADPTFLMPAIAAAIMYVNLGSYAEAEGIVARVEAARDHLGPMESATLDMVRGWLRGDDHAAYDAAVRQARLAPGSIGEYQVAEQARRINRPGETVRVLTAMGAERGELRGWVSYWRELTVAHHMLGDHRAELKAARRARALYPADPGALLFEVRAQAARGRVTAVERLIDERLANPSTVWPTAGAVMAIAAEELGAHGRPESAHRLFERAVQWHRAQSGDGSGGDPRWGIAVGLYRTGRWDEARDLFSDLAAANPGSLRPQGYLGVIAARRGDRAEAERVDRWLRELDRPYLGGAHTLWRARIAALLGDSETAVDLLRQAFATGLQHGPWHHTDPDLDPLRDYRPFRELLRPRGLTHH